MHIVCALVDVHHFHVHQVACYTELVADPFASRHVVAQSGK